MNIGSLELNPGAQTDFVLSDDRYSAFIGGLGSGKTYAGVLRGLKYALQPKPAGVFHPPHGLIASSSYPALRDTIIPKLQEICALTGVADFERDYRKNDMTLTLKNGALVRLRSLDKPDNIIRGPEYTWAFIDEGRNVRLADWKLVHGRLRQAGYKHAAWVASTPNGFDWMYRVFHEKGDLHEEEYPTSHWYNAPMTENMHLPADHVKEMQVTYSGRWYEQEVLGKFIGLVEGGVFPDWNPEKFCQPVPYNRDLPLYTGWDFGIGDPGVCLFFQVDWQPATGDNGSPFFLPSINIIDFLEAKDLSAKDWADLFKQHVADFYPEGVSVRNFGDPAGTQRRVGMTTSVIEDLQAAGVQITAAMRRPPDYAIRILSNMMAGGRVRVDRLSAERVSNALSSHKWAIDKDGVRTGTLPVHDWTSHIVDALRYGVSMIPLRPREGAPPPPVEGRPSTYGEVFKQLTEPPTILKRGRRTTVARRPVFTPGPITIRGAE